MLSCGKSKLIVNSTEDEKPLAPQIIQLYGTAALINNAMLQWTIGSLNFATNMQGQQDNTLL